VREYCFSDCPAPNPAAVLSSVHIKPRLLQIPQKNTTCFVPKRNNKIPVKDLLQLHENGAIDYLAGKVCFVYIGSGDL
jgi:hypothetical protein